MASDTLMATLLIPRYYRYCCTIMSNTFATVSCERGRQGIHWMRRVRLLAQSHICWTETLVPQSLSMGHDRAEANVRCKVRGSTLPSIALALAQQQTIYAMFEMVRSALCRLR